MQPPAGRPPSAEWRAFLYGNFHLENPSGAAVSFDNRKVEGLFAVLAVHRRYGMERTKLAEILWPGQGAKGMANLRQSLSLLRKAIGEGSIVSSRSHCCFSSEFPLDTDHEHPDRRRSFGFMPGHSGEWFEEVRLDACEAESVDRDTPFAAFLNMVEWYRQRDPQKMFDLMRGDPAMVGAIDAHTLSRLVASMPDKPECAGWKLFWRGIVAVQVDSVENYSRLFRLAMEAGLALKDLDLVSDCVQVIGAGLILRNRLRAAHSWVTQSDELVTKHCGSRRDYSSKMLLGLIHVHAGDSREGFRLLAETESLISDPVNRGLRRSVRGFLEASCGFVDQAETSMHLAGEDLSGVGHRAFDEFNSLTSALIDLNRGRSSQESTSVERLLSQYTGRLEGDLKVYGSEICARAWRLRGDAERASKAMSLAGANRNARGMGVTPWDEMRLRQVSL